MLKIGDKAPDFDCKNENGEIISLSSFKGKKIILFFFPKANTSGCTKEACNLSDNYSLLKSKGYEIIGISADSIKDQKKFKEKYHFPYNLLADENKDIIKSYGVWGKKKFMGKEFDGILRTSFIIDENGIISKIIEKVDVDNHTNQILD